MAITKVSSSIFTLNKNEINDFAKRARGALQLGSEGGGLSMRPQARLESLRMTTGLSIHPSLRGVTATTPTQIAIEVRLQDGSGEKYLIVLNVYKKQLNPRALHFDGQNNKSEQEEWDTLTVDEIIERLG